MKSVLIEGSTLRNGIDSLQTTTILDIGFGLGYWIQEFIKLGARAENVAGIDRLDWRVEAAAQLSDRRITGMRKC
jgi:2-polyprenyl-3-methyl-5-hydroxy-6-metoxy-1,4-benzoquinol methylase